jgi:hypothetical protein
MRAFLRMAATVIKMKRYLAFWDCSSCRGALRRRPSLQRRLGRFRTTPGVEYLEARLVPFQAISVAEPNGTFTYVPPTDINAAFSGILRASGRSDVVTVQTRYAANDNFVTTAKSVIDAEFTPTGLVTTDSQGNRHPVTVEQFANYFGFDHLNWYQEVTIPGSWSAKYSYTGGTLGQTFPDPQPVPITITGNDGVPETVPSAGDLSYLYERYDDWKQFFVDPLPLLSTPTPPRGSINSSDSPAPTQPIFLCVRGSPVCASDHVWEQR